MNVQELVLLLPCHSLDDFPYYHEGEDADGLLAGYSALWHPSLIAGVRKTPTWHSSYTEGGEMQADRLVVLPQICENDLPGYWMDEARGVGAIVIPGSGAPNREAIVQAALTALEIKDAENLDEELVRDFLALGVCHLLAELLTVQMRYTSLIDHAKFETHLLEAADAALAGEVATAREKLQPCFDALAESRDHFYPVDGYLIDLTLVAPNTIGDALRQELEGDVATNLLASADVIRAMESSAPETLEALRQATERGTATLIGGDASEEDFSLRSPEETLDIFRQGLSAYEDLVGCRPRVFGRRSYGLSPLLPQILDKLGFLGAIHFTLDGGRFPQPDQSKTRWEGLDGSVVDVFARLPVDASKSENFISLPQRMGESMDMDHVAVVCFAHWPGESSPWFDDLKRISKYANVLGKFVSLEHFLKETDTPRDHSRFLDDEYRSPYLTQAVAAESPNPISRGVERRAASQQAYLSSAIETMTGVLGIQPESNQGTSDRVETALAGFAATLPRTKATSSKGYLVVNPLSSPRRVALETPDLERPPSSDPSIVAAYETDGKKEVLVDVPPMGYAWLTSSEKGGWTAPKGKRLVEGNVLRNEHFEVTINEHTGAIQSIHNQSYRGNLLSQQLALRTPGSISQPGEVWRNPDQSATYSVMAADSVEITAAGPVTAAITAEGRLLDQQGQELATFRQVVSLTRGREILDLEMVLNPREELLEDPWSSYYAARFAWPKNATEIFRSVGLCHRETDAGRLEAPDYLEIQGGPFRTTILTGGMPYHRRIEDNSIDTLLIVRGEQQRTFRMAIGLNLTHPQSAAIEQLAPPMILPADAASPTPAMSWLFHVEAKNVTATHWELVLDENGCPRGVRVRLLETAGRQTGFRLATVHSIESARKLDFLGGELCSLKPDGDSVKIEMTRHEWCELELVWQA